MQKVRIFRKRSYFNLRAHTKSPDYTKRAYWTTDLAEAPLYTEAFAKDLLQRIERHYTEKGQRPDVHILYYVSEMEKEDRKQ